MNDLSREFYPNEAGLSTLHTVHLGTAFQSVRAHESSLRILRSLYARATTFEEKMRHRKTILAVLHELHVEWEKVWRCDIEAAHRNGEMKNV